MNGVTNTSENEICEINSMKCVFLPREYDGTRPQKAADGAVDVLLHRDDPPARAYLHFRHGPPRQHAQLGDATVCGTRVRGCTTGDLAHFPDLYVIAPVIGMVLTIGDNRLVQPVKPSQSLEFL